MAFVGASIFGAVSSIGGAAAALAPIVSVASAGAGLVSAFGDKSKSVRMPELQQAPRVPDFNAIQASETKNILVANQRRTKTILTNPLGETDNSIIKTKQLVGKLGE